MAYVMHYYVVGGFSSREDYVAVTYIPGTVLVARQVDTSG